jgi:hypothetical protein
MSEDRTENGQDWQPVQIAPPEQSFLCAFDSVTQENCRRNAGKIIHVRVEGGTCSICGGRRLIVSPKDFDSLDILERSSRTPIVCESQVLAD